MLEDDPGAALSIDPESAGEVGRSLRKVMWEGAGILRDAGGLEGSIAATLDLERGLARRPAARPRGGARRGAGGGGGAWSPPPPGGGGGGAGRGAPRPGVEARNLLFVGRLIAES